MEANGKNLIMFEYNTHHYMDMYPETSFRTEVSKEAMDAFIARMREMWCSGTVSDAKEVTPLEFFEARQSKYWKGCEEQLDEAACDCRPEWVEEYNFYVEHKDYDIPALKTAWIEYCHEIDEGLNVPENYQ